MLLFSGDSDLLNDSKDTRVRFDKKTGKAVVTSDPKQKPESVRTLTLINLCRTSSKPLKLVTESSSWQLDLTSVPSLNPITVSLRRILTVASRSPC